MSIVYVGLDLGSSAFHQVAMNRDGVATVNRNFPTSAANLIKAFSDQRGEIWVHLEAGELAPWAAAVIEPLVKRVVCSHPRDNAWIAKDGDKYSYCSLPGQTPWRRCGVSKLIRGPGRIIPASTCSPVQWLGPHRPPSPIEP